MAALTRLARDLRDEAVRRWYYLAIIFASVGIIAGLGLLIEVAG